MGCATPADVTDTGVESYRGQVRSAVAAHSTVVEFWNDIASTVWAKWTSEGGGVRLL